MSSPSVCSSVALVDCDRIGWNSSKIISRLVSVGRSLSADPNTMDLLYSKGNNRKFEPKVTVDLIAGDIRSQITTEWLRISQRSQWRAYRKHHRSFEWYHLSPLRPPSPKMGGLICPWYANGQISATSDPIHFMFGSRVGFSGSADRMASFPVISNPRWRPAAMLENFEWPCTSAKGHAIHFILRCYFYGSVFGVSRTNGVTFGYIKPKLAPIL